jgi:hypothetical protein
MNTETATRSPTADAPEQHSLGQSIVLHLLPGLLVVVFYMVTAPLALKMGFPSFFALMVAIGMILIPFELGYLLLQGKKRNGTPSLKGIVAFREPGSERPCHAAVASAPQKAVNAVPRALELEQSRTHDRLWEPEGHVGPHGERASWLEQAMHLGQQLGQRQHRRRNYPEEDHRVETLCRQSCMTCIALEHLDVAQFLGAHLPPYQLDRLR